MISSGTANEVEFCRNRSQTPRSGDITSARKDNKSLFMRSQVAVHAIPLTPSASSPTAPAQLLFLDYRSGGWRTDDDAGQLQNQNTKHDPAIPQEYNENGDSERGGSPPRALRSRDCGLRHGLTKA